MIYHRTIMQPPITRYATIACVLLGLTAGGCTAHVGPDGEPLSGDALIVAEVHRLIDDDEALIGADLRVESREGVVIISGVQASAERLGRLFQDIARVRGVAEVVNRVRIIR